MSNTITICGNLTREPEIRYTKDGEHRSKVEIVADEIGPSLRFATADVRRTMRSVEGERESSEQDDTEVPSI
jgi:single-stranded DNA-binding protein